MLLTGQSKISQNIEKQEIRSLDQPSQFKKSKAAYELYPGEDIVSLLLPQNTLQPLDDSVNSRSNQPDSVLKRSQRLVHSTIGTVETSSTSAWTEHGTLSRNLLHCQSDALYGRSAWDAAAAWRNLYRGLSRGFTGLNVPPRCSDSSHSESSNMNVGHIQGHHEVPTESTLKDASGLLNSLEFKKGSENTDDEEIFVNISMSELSKDCSPTARFKEMELFLPAFIAPSNLNAESTKFGHGDSSRSLTAFAVDAISTAASSGLRRIRSVLKSSRADVHHNHQPILKHASSKLTPSAESIALNEHALQEDEGEDQVSGYVVHATINGMKWYFRSEFHGTALLLVIWNIVFSSFSNVSYVISFPSSYCACLNF